MQQQQQHECTIAVYNKNMDNWQTKSCYHYLIKRLNQEFFKCAVYDSNDDTTGKLCGVEYMISKRIFNVLPPHEQKLWHSHTYDTPSSKENLWINMMVAEALNMTEFQDLSNIYGKFWCTWEWDNGDALPLGMPSSHLRAMEGVSSEDHLEGEIDAEGRKNKHHKERFITYVRRVKGGSKLKIARN
ncbi:hypothetical protein IFM89_002149 [Coptis chinensis]|uniref:Uncharacterized protein n=1 Tax=Coptis chinensis TaxID=261450 RepID=A0A835IAZ2_9MAGN|nr:hypothetical protein IFM89_002149 [Coptis chinensis]